MATQNAIASNIPIEVTKGGTGSTSLTNHSVLVGATTSVTSIAVGSTGQFLGGNTGADPSWQTPTGTGAITFHTDSGDATVSANAITITGGEMIGTTGSGSTVTVNMDRGTNGQVPVAATGATTAYATLASSNGSITYATGANTLGLTVTQATTSQLGGSTIATNAEAIAGTDTSKIITADDLKAKLGTQTNHGVLVGAGTTAAVTALAVGSTGTLLVGSSAADPAFGSSATGDFTFTSSTAGETRIFTVSNTDNSNTSSGANIIVKSGGSSAGDGWTTYTVATQTNWSTGVDNSDSDTYKISQSGSLGTNDCFVVTKGGNITQPLNSAFLAQNGLASNLTGDGTAVTMTGAGGVSWSERFDNNANFAAGTFTAPVAGVYQFNVIVEMSGLTASHTTGLVQLVTTGRTYEIGTANIGAMRDASNAATLSGSVIALMSASDTAVLSCTVSGGTKVVDFVANTTCFSGSLVG